VSIAFVIPVALPSWWLVISPCWDGRYTRHLPPKAVSQRPPAVQLEWYPTIGRILPLDRRLCRTDPIAAPWLTLATERKPSPLARRGLFVATSGARSAAAAGDNRTLGAAARRQSCAMQPHRIVATDER